MADAAAATPSWTVGWLVATIAETLSVARIPNARAEARDLVAAVLDQPRLWPTAHRNASLGPDAVERARRAAARRSAGAPFAYAVGRAAFRHLTLEVDERVLIPRQETEVLVEEVLELQRSGSLPAGGVAADVGTGSGAIALALASEGRFERVVATDLSRDALSVARRNAERLTGALRAPVELRQGSLLAPLAGLRLRALVSNPPYIAHEEARDLPASVRDWEPALALFSGEEGMAAISALITGAPALLEPGGLLALEVDSRRASRVAELAERRGHYEAVRVRQDLARRDRIVLARRRA